MRATLLISALVFGALGSCAARSTMRVPLTKTLSIPASQATLVGVVEDRGAIFVEFDDRIEVYRASTEVRRIDPTRSTWTSITKMQALDGTALWVVATDSNGGIWRVFDTGERVRINDRLSIERAANFAAAGSTFVARLSDGLAIGDGEHLSRYGFAGESFAVSRGLVAIRNKEKIELWDLTKDTRVRFPISGARFLAFARGRLVAATSDSVFIQTSEGMQRIAGGAVKALAGGDKIWILDAGHLSYVDGTSWVETIVDVDDATGIFAAGDSVWLVRPNRIDQFSAEDDRDWFAGVVPIFRRSCARCHLPGGSSGIDLSSPEAWQRLHDQLRKRVVVERSMPPNVNELSEQERQTLGALLR